MGFIRRRSPNLESGLGWGLVAAVDALGDTRIRSIGSTEVRPGFAKVVGTAKLAATFNAVFTGAAIAPQSTVRHDVLIIIENGPTLSLCAHAPQAANQADGTVS